MIDLRAWLDKLEQDMWFLFAWVLTRADHSEPATTEEIYFEDDFSLSDAEYDTDGYFTGYADGYEEATLEECDWHELDITDFT